MEIRTYAYYRFFIRQFLLCEKYGMLPLKIYDKENTYKLKYYILLKYI